MHEVNADGRAPIDRALRPRSIAIVGVSSTPGSAGRNALNNLVAGGYDGDIHLVSRSGAEVDGRTSVTSVSDLPEGVDLAILAVPAAAMAETVSACAERRVGVAIIFASGFAELGEEGKAAQDALVAAASAGGMSLIGPNCLGYEKLREAHVRGLQRRHDADPVSERRQGGRRAHAERRYDGAPDPRPDRPRPPDFLRRLHRQ